MSKLLKDYFEPQSATDPCFSVWMDYPDFIGLSDLLDLSTKPCRSVTNAAERVVELLAQEGYDLTKPVVYCDTEGNWDQLLVENGKFSGFRILNAKSFEEAVEKVKKHV